MLVAGNVAALLTMALHPHIHPGFAPSPRDLIKLAQVDRAVHGLALAGIVLVFLGALALTRRLAGGNRLALAALVLYGLAAAAILVAGTLDGFVAADLLDRLAVGGPNPEPGWTLLDYNTRIVIAFASVYTVATCAAIFLWSLAAVRARRLAPGLGLVRIGVGSGDRAGLVHRAPPAGCARVRTRRSHAGRVVRCRGDVAVASRSPLMTDQGRSLDCVTLRSG